MLMVNSIEMILNKIKEIEDILTPDDYAVDEHIEYYNKTLSILKILEHRIRNQKSVLYKSTVLEILVKKVNNLYSYISSWHQTQNSSYINNINNVLDEILESIAKIPSNQKGETSLVLDKIVKDFENSNLQIIQNLRKENNELHNQVKSLSQNVAKLERKIEEKSNQLDNITTAQQQQFSAAQEKRLNDFSKKLSDFSSQFETQKAQQDNSYNDNFRELTDVAQKHLDEMEQIQHKIEKIYGIVGQEAIVGSQKAYADKARRFATGLFWGAIVLMLSFAVVVSWPILEAFCNTIHVFDPQKTFANLNWSVLLCRVPVAAVLLLPAVYMANESKKQRDKENKYRELEIKMAAIEPYFNNISEAKKDNQTQIPEKDMVKLDLAKALLSPKIVTSDKNVIIPQEISNLIENIVKIVCKK